MPFCGPSKRGPKLDADSLQSAENEEVIMTPEEVAEHNKLHAETTAHVGDLGGSSSKADNTSVTDGSSSSSSVLAVSAPWVMPSLTDVTTTMDLDEDMIVTAEQWTKFGLEDKLIAPRIFKIDQSADSVDVEAELMRMNVGASWKVAFDPVFDTDLNNRRFMCAFPNQVEAHAPNADLQRMRLEFSLPLESPTEGELIAFVEEMHTQDVDAKIVEKGTLYLTLDPKCIERQLNGSLGDLGDSDPRRYHAAVLAVQVMESQNSTNTAFRVRLEAANMEYQEGQMRYTALCDPIGICNMTDVQAEKTRAGTPALDMGQYATTLRAKTPAGTAANPKLATMYTISPAAAARMSSPDMLRWSHVNVENELACANKLRYMKSPDVHINAAINDEGVDPSHMPTTIVEYIFYAHGRELAQACLLLEEQRLRLGKVPAGGSGLDADGKLVAFHSLDVTRSISVPREFVYGTTNPEKRWRFPYAAFEMVLYFYTSRACQVDTAVNLQAPLRLALTPPHGFAGWTGMGKNYERDVKQNRVEPVHINIVIQVDFTNALSVSRITKEDRKRIMDPLAKQQTRSAWIAHHINTPSTVAQRTVTQADAATVATKSPAAIREERQRAILASIPLSPAVTNPLRGFKGGPSIDSPYADLATMKVQLRTQGFTDAEIASMQADKLMQATKSPAAIREERQRAILASIPLSPSVTNPLRGFKGGPPADSPFVDLATMEAQLRAQGVTDAEIASIGFPSRPAMEGRSARTGRYEH